MDENLRHEAPGPELLSRNRGEGSPISRPISQIRADLLAADRRSDQPAVASLERELRQAADQAGDVRTAKRGG